jgi:DNA polymerase III sliding clamp (beta) subunit (PCNA family)
MQKEELLEVLKPLARFVAPKSGAIAQFKQLCLRDNLAYAYNGESGCAIRLQLGVSCTVPADRFLEIVGKMPDNQDIKISLKDSTLRVRCKRTSLTLSTGSADTYPDLVPAEYVEVCEANNLLDCVATCASAVNDTAKNRFGGIAIGGDYVYSTDGLRATRAKLSSPFRGQLVHIPLKSAKSLPVLGDPVKMIAWKNIVGALYSDPPAMWMSATIAAKYPQANIDDLLSQPAGELVEFPEESIEALDRLEAMADAESRRVDVVSQQGNLHFVARAREVGELIENFDWDYQGSFQMRVNPAHFREALLLSRKVGLSTVAGKNATGLRFYGDGVDHVMSLYGD